MNRHWDLKKRYGDNITKITDAAGKPLNYTINKTMMRIDLPVTLKPGQQFILKIEWNYFITDRMKYFGRGGYGKIISLLEVGNLR